MLKNGIYTVAPTPFDSDGSVDLTSVGRMASSLVELGVEGLLVLGVMGEADKLLDDERDAVLRRFVEAVDGAAEIVVGTNHPGSVGATVLSQRAEELGANAVMISPPRMAKPNPEAVYEFFDSVASGVSIDIVLQDHPTSSGVFMSVDLITRIADEVERVTALKLEDPPTPPKMAAVVASGADALSVFGGLGGVKLIEELDSGAAGTMTGFAFPEILREIWQLHSSGDRDAARKLFFRYMPLIVFEGQPLLSLPVRKRLYQKRGFIDADVVRAPAGVLDPGTERELNDLLVELELE